MHHLTLNLQNPLWYPIKLNPISLIRSSINTHSPSLNSFILIHQYRFPMPVKLLNIFCTLPRLCLCKYPFTKYISCPLKIPNFPNLTYTSDFGCTVIPTRSLMLLGIMNDACYMLFPQQKCEETTYFIPCVSSHRPLHTQHCILQKYTNAD